MISKNEIKQLRFLHSKKYREEKQVFIVEGDKMVREAIESPMEVVQLYYCSGSSQEFESIGTLISEKEMKQISQLSSSSPSLAVVRPNEFSESLQTIAEKPLLILDSIRDPGNLGTIIRTADWFGIETILVSKDTVDCFNSKVVQSTMGSIFRVQISYRDLVPAMLELKKVEVPLFGAFMDGDSPEILSNVVKRGALVIGSESFGISDAVKREIDHSITIKKDGMGESLNAAVATSILLYQWSLSPRN
ncbi:MAG TPA: RNA methyltransferase [Flavobacteriales bacterium]|nr:RNA methyltransferase [Flavobacteriales bacterium]